MKEAYVKSLVVIYAHALNTKKVTGKLTNSPSNSFDGQTHLMFVFGTDKSFRIFLLYDPRKDAFARRSWLVLCFKIAGDTPFNM